MVRQGQRVIFDLDGDGRATDVAPRVGGRHADARRAIASWVRRPCGWYNRSGASTTESEHDEWSEWQRTAEALGRRLGSHPPARRRVLVRRLAPRSTTACARSSSPAARSRRSTRRSGRTATGPTPTRVTSPASRTARSSARPASTTPARTTTGAQPDEMRAELTGPLHRGDARPHDVRGAVLDGAARVEHRPHRRAAHRLGLRRREHADHDPHGPEGARRARRRRVRAVPALGRRAARARPGRRAVAVQPRQQVHRPLPRDPRDLVLRLRLRRQRPARQEVLRPAHRLGDGPRRRLAGRAHAHPQADQPGQGVEVHRRRVPVGVRQDEPGDARADDPRLDGRDGRRRHLLDEVRRRRPALRDQPRGRVLRRRAGHQLRDQPQRHGHAVGQLHLHQHRARPTTATCGGRA